MSEFCLILTAEQAARDWSGSAQGTALRPSPLADGKTWVLPARVATNPAHEAHRDFLETLPKRMVADSEFATIESLSAAS